MATATLTAPVTTKTAWAGRVISTLLVLFLLFDGVMKLFKPTFVLEACAKLGVPESAVVPIGALLVACTILYALPATAVLGAILLTGYLGGAIMTHVRVGDPPFTVVFGTLFGVLVWLGLFLRDARLRALIPLRRAGT